jgi:hypothetical protein
MPDSSEITIVGADGREWTGRGEVVTRTLRGMKQIDGSIGGVDLFDVLGASGVRVRLESGEEAPIVVTQIEGLSASFVVNGPLQKPRA